MTLAPEEYLQWFCAAPEQLTAGHHEKAMESAKQALEKDPKSDAARGLIAEIWSVQDKCGEARSDAEQALALDPKESHALAASEHCGER